MSLTVLVSERGFQPEFESDHDDRRGIKPRSLSSLFSEVLPSLHLFPTTEGGKNPFNDEMMVEDGGPS